ncbi:MAG: hypothetical protein ACREU7_11655 [Burkholderiales bacterium]
MNQAARQLIEKYYAAFNASDMNAFLAMLRGALLRRARGARHGARLLSISRKSWS